MPPVIVMPKESIIPLLKHPLISSKALLGFQAAPTRKAAQGGLKNPIAFQKKRGKFRTSFLIPKWK
jgi:hypothetical protein